MIDYGTATTYDVVGADAVSYTHLDVYKRQDKDNVDEQVNILDEELSRYPAALAISIADAKACEVQFDQAGWNGTPIVTFDSSSDYPGISAFVSTDNSASATEAANRLAEAMGESGEVMLFMQMCIRDSHNRTSSDL